MGQFLRVNGDYNIQAIADPVNGGTITLDTGPQVGTVIVTGNLQVEGETVYVAATNLDIEDNIIVLNKGEAGNGVTLDYSGIQIDRGTADGVSFVWNDLTDSWQLVGGPDGNYSFDETSKLRLRYIVTNSITDEGDLTLIATGTGVVKVLGTDNYEDQVTHDDDIPNKKYVDDAIQNNPTFQITKLDTRIIIADKEVTPNDIETPGSLAYFTDVTGYSTFGESAASVIIDSDLVATFYPNRVVFGNSSSGGLEFSGTEITTENSLTNENITLRTQGTGKIQLNYALQMDQIAGVPAYVLGSTLLYSADPSLGTSGVFFVNDSATERLRTGELISKNKALVFSMIF